jgi:hypothetical protein
MSVPDRRGITGGGQREDGSQGPPEETAFRPGCQLQLAIRQELLEDLNTG